MATANVGDNFEMLVTPFCHRYPLSFNISAGQQHPKDVLNMISIDNIEIL